MNSFAALLFFAKGGLNFQIGCFWLSAEVTKCRNAKSVLLWGTEYPGLAAHLAKL